MKWKLGTFAGIGVFIHWSFWILPFWILFSSISAGAGFSAGLASVIFVFAIFGCVVLHEFGHALMARSLGVGTRDITLYPIGGVASLDRIPRRPSHELAIALAGPLVNVVIAGTLFAGMAAASGPLALGGPFGGSFLSNLLWVNVGLVVFNMLPAFPMDGGLVLRSLMATILPYTTATEIAARTGQGIAILFGIAGLWNPMLFFLAVFVFLAAQAELTMARLQARPPLHQPAAAAADWAPPQTGVRVYPRRLEDGRIVWVQESL